MIEIFEMTELVFTVFSNQLMAIICLLMAIVHFWESGKCKDIQWRKIFIGMAWLQMAIVFVIFAVTEYPQPIPSMLARWSFGWLVMSYLGYKIIYIEVMLRHLWKKLTGISQALFQLLWS